MRELTGDTTQDPRLPNSTELCRGIYPDGLSERFKEDAGKKYRPANGEEGEHFMRAYCYCCTKGDTPDAPGECDMVERSFWLDIDDPDYPVEWQYGVDGQPKCTAFCERT
jgi:hypothetical protein